MSIGEWLMSFLGKKHPLLDERTQIEREERTERASNRAIETRQKAEQMEKSVTRAADRIGSVRQSFEKANKRLGTR